ncbi:MAG: hypothetical protein ACP5UL_06525 [Thermoplasmata archaeon]
MGFGSLIGMFTGALYGGMGAVVTWSISCNPSVIGSISFTVPAVLESGTPIGSILGIFLDMVCGFIALGIFRMGGR